MRLFALALLLAIASSTPAQLVEVLVTGGHQRCLPIGTPFDFSILERVGSQPELDEMEAVAPAPNGRYLGLAPWYDDPRQAPTGFYVTELHITERNKPLTAPIAGDPRALVVDGAGAMYVLYNRLSSIFVTVFNADGTPRVTWDLGALPGLASGTGIGGATVIDLAANRCTLFFLQNNVIRRFDVCTGTFLPDFATTAGSPAAAIRVLPDGGVLVLAGEHVSQLERFAPDGSRVRTYPVTRATPALMLLHDGGRVVYGQHGCDPAGHLVILNLDTGLVEGEIDLRSVVLPGTVAASESWTAAIGAMHAAAVPAAGPVALIAVAMMLVLAGLIRLR